MNGVMALQGLLPLIVFAIVDIFASVRAAIVSAIVFAILEAGWSYYQFGEVDRLTWISLGLVVVMGAIAFKMRNEMLFKFQPVALSLVSAFALLYFHVFDTPLMVQMLPKAAALLPADQQERMHDPQMIAMIARMDGMMVGACIAHAALVAWAAMHKSTLYWLIMRGAAFYGLIAIVVLLNLVLGLPRVG